MISRIGSEVSAFLKTFSPLLELAEPFSPLLSDEK
jgi:hypothetical protein